MTDPRRIFILANEALNRTVQHIADDQWDQQVPDTHEFTFGRGPTTLAQVVGYHAWDDSWVPDILTGRTMAEVGEDKFGPFDGDLLGEDRKNRFADINARANASVEDLEDLERTIHFSYGDFPAADALAHIMSFRGFRAHDIAKFIGAPNPWTDELVQGMWDLIAPGVDMWRQAGVFGPEVKVAEDEPLADRLLGMSGRQP